MNGCQMSPDPISYFLATMDTTRPTTSFTQPKPTGVRRFKDGLTPQQKELRNSLTQKLQTLPKELGLQLLLEHCYVMIGWHNVTRDTAIGWWGMFQINEPRSKCSTPSPVQEEARPHAVEDAHAES